MDGWVGVGECKLTVHWRLQKARATFWGLLAGRELPLGEGAVVYRQQVRQAALAQEQARLIGNIHFGF